jgi:hypothetical protein
VYPQKDKLRENMINKLIKTDSRRLDKTISEKMLESFLGQQNDVSRYYTHLPTPLLLIVSGIACCVVLTRSRRWDHFNAIHQKYGPKWDNGRGSITPEEAQVVVQLSICFDMPLVLYYAHSFALFKTYAIVSTPSSVALVLVHNIEPSHRSPNS